MKTLHLSLKKDFSSSSPQESTPETRYVNIDHVDDNHNGLMDAGESLVIRQISLSQGTLWSDTYTLSSEQSSSPSLFRDLLAQAFDKRGFKRSVTLGTDSDGVRDNLIFIAPPVNTGDDPEIQATFDLSDGSKRHYD